MNPVEAIIKHAVEAYRKDLSAYENFEICAYIFSFLFIRVSRKPGEEALSMMLVLALAIWEYSGSKIFKDKKINGDELMRRKTLFMESGFGNRVRVLQTNLLLAAESGCSQNEFFSPEKRATVSLTGNNRHQEEQLKEWVCVLSSILPRLDQLIVSAYTTQVKTSSQQAIPMRKATKFKEKRKTWGRIWLTLSMALIAGGILFFCILLFR